MADYSIRYAANWTEISAQAKRMTNGSCCYPNCDNPATETHHVLYKDKQGAIAGREQPGVHVFGLCEEHHQLAHSPRNWRKDYRCPELGNKNTPKFYLLLRQGWLEKLNIKYNLFSPNKL